MTDGTAQLPPPNYEEASAAPLQYPPTWVQNNANTPFQGFSSMPFSPAVGPQSAAFPMVAPYTDTNGGFPPPQTFQMTGMPNQQNPYFQTFSHGSVSSPVGFNHSSVIPMTFQQAPIPGTMQQAIPQGIQNGEFVNVLGPTSVYTKVVNGAITTNAQHSDRTPVNLVCQFCKESVITETEGNIKKDSASLCGEICCLVCMLLSPIFWPCVCCVLYSLFQDGVKHSCPRCQACIGVHFNQSRTGFATTRDQALMTIARPVRFAGDGGRTRAHGHVAARRRLHRRGRRR